MQILFTDLDGTLLTDQKTISPAQQDGIFRMLENGHFLVLTSGRPLNSILEVQKNFSLMHPNVFIIAYNGALVYDSFQEKTIAEFCVDRQDARYILDEAKKEDLHCHTYSATHIISERQTKELDFYRTHIHLPAIIAEDALSELSSNPHKLIAISLESRDVLSKFQNKITPVIGDRISPVFSNNQYLELFSKDAGKGNAMLALCKHLNIPLCNTFAVGDEENDLSMIIAAHTGIAMANACSTLKEKANYITKNSNNHDGLLELLVHFRFLS